VRHVRPARGRRGGGAGSSSTGHWARRNAGAIAYRRGVAAFYPRYRAFAGASARAEAQAVAGACRPASSLLRGPRAPRRGCCFVELRNTKNERRIGASTVRRRRRSPGARPVKPAVGWYMPVGFRSGQNRATCGSWGTVRGPCADPSWSSVEQLFMRHGSISPLPPRPPFFPHYCQMDVTLATPPFTPSCW
jgi:hypothetical protein